MLKADDSSKRNKDDAAFVYAIAETLNIAPLEIVNVTRLVPKNLDRNHILS